MGRFNFKVTQGLTNAKIIEGQINQARGIGIVGKKGALRVGTGIASNIIKANLFRVPDSETEDSDIKSYLGTPVFSNLTFGDLAGDSISSAGSSNNYTDIDGNLISFEPLSIDTVIMIANVSKNIVKTTLQGRNRTVKEYISRGDYQITVTGRISNKDNVYPKEDFAKLVTIANIPAQIKVVSEFLQFLSVNYAVIENFRSIQEEGIRNEQLFELTLIEDDPPEGLV